MNKRIYKHVVVFGMDGMGKFNSCTSTPRIDEIFGDSSVSWDTLSMNPTISGENWGAMLIGADPMIHGITNAVAGRFEYRNKELPSVFSRIRRAYPEAVLCSCCNWSVINRGIIEQDLGVEFFSARTDEEVAALACQCAAKKPDFLFIQFDDVDGAGHDFGYGEKGHLEAITKADGQVGRIFDAYGENGILDETLFLIIADHGGVRVGHGGYLDTEKYVFFGARGKYVPKNTEIGTSCVKDIAATVLYALGVEIPPYDKKGFSSQIPSGIFENEGDGYRTVESLPAVHKNEKTPEYGSAKGLGSYFDRDEIKLAMFFDGNLEDASGKCRITPRRNVEYLEGVNGLCGRMGKTGHALVENIEFKGSFSIATWVKTDRSLLDAAALCGNRAWWWRNRSDEGFVLGLRCADTVFNVGSGGDDFQFYSTFPENISEGFIHCIISVDLENKKIRCYYDFELVHEKNIPEAFLDKFHLDVPFVVGNDGPEIYNRISHDLYCTLDDLFIFNGAFDEARVEKLKRYYGK